MTLATEVTLPKDVYPRFPNSCVWCHEEPDSTAKISQNSQNPFLAYFFPILLFFGWSRTEFPICRSCKWKFFVQRWGRLAMCWGILIATIPFIWPYFDEWSAVSRRLALLGVGLGVLLPYIAYEVFWPRAFNTTAGGNNVDYEFASETYALRFALLNREHIVKTGIEFLGHE